MDAALLQKTILEEGLTLPPQQPQPSQSKIKDEIKIGNSKNDSKDGSGHEANRDMFTYHNIK